MPGSSRTRRTHNAELREAFLQHSQREVSARCRVTERFEAKCPPPSGVVSHYDLG